VSDASSINADVADDWVMNFASIPAHWSCLEFDAVFENVPLTGLKIPQKEYEQSGRYPVIDQGSELVGGYTNDADRILSLPRPAIVFGDHTKCFKYLSTPFAPGADGIKVLLPKEGILEKYVYHLCKSLRLPDRGYSRHFSFLKKCKFPVPPIEEQKDIVAMIESLLSQLDSGIESLKTAREQLKVYRQAVLKHAFEGRLTAQWREENKDKLESPEKLLARIQHERGARYQQQLREWQTAVKEWEKYGKEGRTPGKPIKPKALPSLKEVEIEQLDELPIDWIWVRVGDVASVGTGITPLKSNMSFYADGDVPWVTSGALNESFVRQPSSYVTTKALNETNLRLYPPNTLVVALYGEGKTRGKCSELLIEAATNQAIAAIVLGGVAEGFRRFLKWFLTKNYEAMRLGSSGGVQPNLNLGIIEAMAVPFCSLTESIELAEILDAEFSRIEQMESDLVSQIKRTEILRQSILKQAFSGQLVRQDTNDKPASTLFERIFAEKSLQIPDK
jgi:type I restriction enzyme, S subunit